MNFNFDKFDDEAVEELSNKTQNYILMNMKAIQKNANNLSGEAFQNYFYGLCFELVGCGYECGIKTACKVSNNALRAFLNK